LGIKGVEEGREGAYVLKYGGWGVMKKIWTEKNLIRVQKEMLNNNRRFTEMTKGT
jgi:hypothetical protein